MTPAELKLAYDFGKEGIKLIQKIRDKVKKTDPIYNEIDKLHRIITNMKDSINLAQDKYFNLSSENMKLQEKLNKASDEEIEEKDYTLEEITPGVFIYSLNSDPRLKFCQFCFSDGKKSLLQFESPNPHFSFYNCGKCGKEISIDKR